MNLYEPANAVAVPSNYALAQVGFPSPPLDGCPKCCCSLREWTRLLPLARPWRPSPAGEFLSPSPKKAQVWSRLRTLLNEAKIAYVELNIQAGGADKKRYGVKSPRSDSFQRLRLEALSHPCHPWNPWSQLRSSE
jgi:hypothetical protein